MLEVPSKRSFPSLYLPFLNTVLPQTKSQKSYSPYTAQCRLTDFLSNFLFLLSWLTLRYPTLANMWFSLPLQDPLVSVWFISSYFSGPCSNVMPMQPTLRVLENSSSLLPSQLYFLPELLSPCNVLYGLVI